MPNKVLAIFLVLWQAFAAPLCCCQWETAAEFLSAAHDDATQAAACCARCAELARIESGTDQSSSHTWPCDDCDNCSVGDHVAGVVTADAGQPRCLVLLPTDLAMLLLDAPLHGHEHLLSMNAGHSWQADIPPSGSSSLLARRCQLLI